MSCNPDNASWVLKYAEWYLYPEGHEHAGRPDPEKNGKIRYLLRIGGELFWSESAEHLIKTYGNPDLPDDHEDQVKPISFMGLFGTIYDNPPLMKSNPTYKSNLEALPRVERERLLLGNWFARPSGSTYFERDWCEEVDYVDEKEVLYTVRTFDFAGTLKSDVNPNPDYTASVRMRKMKDGMYVIDDIRRHRIRHGDWFEWVMDCAAKDPRGTTYYIPEDPNPAAKRASVLFARELSEAGLAVKRLRTNRSKLDRFRPFSSMAQNEGVHFLSNCATCEDSEIYNDNTFAYLELETFTGVRNRGAHGHDDECTLGRQ